MFKGKTVIITGASRGIGKAIAMKFAKQGANIVINYRSSGALVEQLTKELEENGAQVLSVQADVGKDEDAKKLVDGAVNKFGRVDILVNNAGITKDNLIIRMKEEEFDAVINTNLKGTYNCSKYAAAVMLKQRSGKIINMASVVGVVGNAGQTNYSASKAGVIGITKSLAKELAQRGITVNAVAPGFIETDMTDALSEKVKEGVLEQIPLKRLGSPEDIANMVNFLASDDANYITGQVFNVDGGMVM